MILPERIQPIRPLYLFLIVALRRAGLVAGAVFCFKSSAFINMSAAFVENTADGSGGALCGVTCEISLDGVDFSSNSASFGGAVALVSSGSDEDGLPSAIVNCIFESNTATDGGGFHSVAGFDTIENSVFKNNIAREYTQSHR